MLNENEDTLKAHLKTLHRHLGEAGGLEAAVFIAVMVRRQALRFAGPHRDRATTARCVRWRARRDSNPRPMASEATTLSG